MYLWMLPSDGGIRTGRHAHFMCSIMVFVTHSEMDVSKVEQHLLWRWQFFVTQMRNSAIKCCGDFALLYLTDARWVQAYKTVDECQLAPCVTGRSTSVHADISVNVSEWRMDEDGRWTRKKWCDHTGISGSTVFWILWWDFKVYKMAAKWLPQHLN
jgi:hypothetical protein